MTLIDSAGSVTTTTTDAGGAFGFAATLAAGTYTLQTVAPGYVPLTSVIVIPVNSFTVQLPVAGTTPPVTSVAVVIAGPSSLPVGSASQLTAVVQYSDGSRKDVTNVARWASTAPSVATVSISGLMTAYSAGTTTITAGFQDVSGSFDVTTSSH